MDQSDYICKLCKKREKVTFYCEYHDEPGCSTCMMRKHKACKRVTDLEEITNDNIDVQSFNRVLDDLQMLSQTAEVDLRSCLKNNDSSKDECLQQVQRFRDDIDTKLNALQKVIEEEISNKHKTNARKLDNLVTVSNTSKGKISQRKAEFEKMRKSNQYGRMYITSKQAATEINQLKREMNDSLAKGGLNMSYQFRENDEIKSTLCSHDTMFGILEQVVDGSDEYVSMRGGAVPKQVVRNSPKDEMSVPGTKRKEAKSSRQTTAYTEAKPARYQDDRICGVCKQTMTITTSPSGNTRKLSCGHVFCTGCAVQLIKAKRRCTDCGILTGDQPSGTMTVSPNKYGQILINYIIPDGTQGPEHPIPGQPYIGMSEWFMMSRDQANLCRMLTLAFKRRLVFTIGRGGSEGGKHQVEWNIRHTFGLNIFCQHQRL